MDASWQALTPLSSKSYSIYGRIILSIIFLFAVILVAVGYDLNEKANFRCNPNKTIAADLVAKNFVEANCYMEYEKKHHPSVPVGRFIVMNFGLVLVISIAYVGLVNFKVEKFDTKAGQNTEEQSSNQESWEEESYRETRIFVFPLYILHLFLGRLVPILLFMLLIHPANFPSQFKCEWPPKTLSISKPTNADQQAYITTVVDCVNPLGEKFETLATSIIFVDGIIGGIALIEISFLLYRFFQDNDFASDVEFCSMYLLEKRKLTIRQILKRIRKIINENKEFGNLGLGQSGQVLPLSELHFRFLVHEEIESKYLQRHEIYNVYLKQDQASIKNRVVHLFPLDNVQIVIGHNDTTNTTTSGNSAGSSTNTTTNTASSSNGEILQLCDKILIIGREGIGKTTVTKSLLSRWAKGRFLTDKVVVLLRFRSFRKNKQTTLKKMLRQGEGIPSGSNFEELYKFILVNPQKTVLIFDGLDDIYVDYERCSKEDEDTINDHEEPKYMFTIYLKLLTDKLLPGATVLTTARPKKAEMLCNFFKIQFQTRLELLGFSERAIEDNVKIFFQSKTFVADKIWKTIENNPEFLSLCYLPATFLLVCSTLKECFDQAKTDKDVAKFVPKTITELYQRAIRVIVWKELKFTSSFGTRGYLTSDLPQTPDNYMKTLKMLAKSRMESMEASFQLLPEAISQNIISCGLLVHLPDEYYCFLHVTMQEFLTACHIVDEMKDVCDVRLFLSSLSNYVDKPSWHLVVQFVLGLLAEKIRKKSIDVPRESIFTSFLLWIRPLVVSNADKTAKRAALLVIKCLYEMQDSDMVKLCAKEVDGGGNNGCNLDGLNIAPIDSMALFQFLVYVRNLIKLNLTNNQISDLGSLGLVKLLNEKVNFTSLNLTRNLISDKGIKIICDNLIPKTRRLNHLILEINQITADGVRSLCDIMINKGLVITFLSMRSNKIMAAGAKVFCTALIHDKCNITRLNLSGGKIGNDGVNALCAAIQNEKCKLVDLCLNGNDITYDGVESLCKVLKPGNCKLTSLGLQRNKLTARDMEPLRDTLKSKNCKLTKLDLSANELTDIGAECISQGLIDENSCGLLHLSLSNNKLKDRGVKILCDALKTEKCKLTVLDLSCNEIGDMGVKHLCKALENENCKIINLVLINNNMTSTDIQSLRSSFNVAARKVRNRGRLIMVY